MWEQEFLDELCEYVGFGSEHATLLAEMKPVVTPAFPGIVDRFYDAIMANARAMRVFTGGIPQVERQKTFLTGWLESVFSGVYDVDYLQQHARIGRTHVRIKLDQRYMFGAMNLVREGLHAALRGADWPEEKRARGHQALDKICDLELAIMLETYAENHVARMRDSERLATLGQLAGFIGHELRNPLAVMETSLHLLRKRIPLDDEGATRHMRRLGEQVSISSGIITDLLELARDRAIEPTEVPVRPLLEDVIRRVHTGDGVLVAIDVPDDLPEASMDDKQMRHLVSNLVTNASQALEHLPGERLISVSVTRDGDGLLLVVEDNGKGIPEEVRHRLFEPLATTRAKGLGLGLALCRRIAEKHQGEIRASNKPTGGARFEVRLPHAFGG